MCICACNIIFFEHFSLLILGELCLVPGYFRECFFEFAMEVDWCLGSTSLIWVGKGPDMPGWMRSEC